MTWNRGAQLLFGYTAEEVVGKSVTILIPTDRHDEEPKILERIRLGQSVDHYETIRQRKGGSLVNISLTVSPIKNEKGEVVGASKIARDITASKRAQEQQELLLREMDHRVKNLFTLAISVLSLGGSYASSVPQLIESTRDRLSALARAHALTLPQAPSAPHAARPATLHSLLEDSGVLARKACPAIFLRPRRHGEAARDAALEPELLRLRPEHKATAAPANIVLARRLPHLGRAVGFEPGAKFSVVHHHRAFSLSAGSDLRASSVHGRLDFVDRRANAPLWRAPISARIEVSADVSDGARPRLAIGVEPRLGTDPAAHPAIARRRAKASTGLPGVATRVCGKVILTSDRAHQPERAAVL